MVIVGDVAAEAGAACDGTTNKKEYMSALVVNEMRTFLGKFLSGRDLLTTKPLVGIGTYTRLRGHVKLLLHVSRAIVVPAIERLLKPAARASVKHVGGDRSRGGEWEGNVNGWSFVYIGNLE